MKDITIFTPTYNRKDTLKRLYESLLKQDSDNFEWLIIDDGSIDNTELLVEEFIKEKKIEIKYIKQKNGGKHRAINKAVDIAEGRLFFIIDSDDYITSNAVKKILEYEETIKESNEKYAGIAFSKGYSEKELVGNTFKGEYIDATSIERERYNIKGDKAEVFYTDILRKNKFPEFEGEKFLSEAVVWNKIARQGYKLRWFQDIIYICEYRQDGLTKNVKRAFKNSPKGMKLYITEYIQDNKLNFIRRCLLYEYYSDAIYDNKELNKVVEDLNINFITLIFGIILRKILNFVRKLKNRT